MALLAGGEAAHYDVLIVAAGAHPEPGCQARSPSPGPAQAAEVAAVLDAVERGDPGGWYSPSPPRRPGRCPIYELAMMAAVDLRDRGVTNATLSLVTPEDEPLRIFGPAAGAALREMLDARGVALLTTPVRWRCARACCTSSPAPLRADAVVSVPGSRVPRSPACRPTLAASSLSTQMAASPGRRRLRGR